MAAACMIDPSFGLSRSVRVGSFRRIRRQLFDGSPEMDTWDSLARALVVVWTDILLVNTGIGTWQAYVSNIDP